MARRYPDLTSEEGKAFDAIWKLVKEHKDTRDRFHHFYELTDDPEAYEETPPPARMPALRIVPVGSPTDPVTQNHDEELFDLIFVCWSPGWDIRDLWALQSLVRKVVSSKAKRNQLANEGGVQFSYWRMGPSLPEGGGDTRYLVGNQIARVSLWLPQPA